MDSKKHTFDWHKEPEGFLKWMLTHVAAASKDDELFDELSDASDQFTNVELQILVNGVEVDAKGFVERIEWAMDRGVEDEAKRLVRDMHRLGDLKDAVHDFERGIKNKMREFARDQGIELDTEDW